LVMKQAAARPVISQVNGSQIGH